MHPLLICRARLHLTVQVVGLTLGLGLAQAQESGARDDAWLLRTAAVAFFHIDVTGTPAPSNGQPAFDAQRWGKAFAIGPDLLLTANHVLGNSAEWQPVPDEHKEVTRALHPIARQVTLSRADSDPDAPMRNLVVMPAVSAAIDAATIIVPDLGISGDQVLQLSLCRIAKGQPYKALMVAGDPTLPASVRAPVVSLLTAAGYEPARYGGLYVFDADARNFESEPWGHDGSPIFDSEYNVVALISAVTVDGPHVKILATPIQSLIPGTDVLMSEASAASPKGAARPKCSMADLVGEIDHNVSTHATWTIAPEREEGQLTGLLKFSYDSINEKPNIKSIRVEYEFFGTRKRGEDRIVRFPPPIANGEGDGDVTVKSGKGSLARVFRDDDILNAGQQALEPSLAVDGGAIAYVHLLITPDYSDGERQRNEPFEIDIPWAELVGK